MNLKIHERLSMTLFDSEEEKKIQFNYKVFPTEESTVDISHGSSLTASFLEIYEYCSGFNISWEAVNNEQIYGNTEFLPLANVLSSWEDTLYEEQDVKEDDLITTLSHLTKSALRYCVALLISPMKITNPFI